MQIAAALSALDEAPSEERFTRLAQALDPLWIEQALQATGTATLRRRKLPADSALWLVIGMALLRDRSIQDVVHHLSLVLPSLQGTPQTLSGSALVQARDRLGPEPLAWLFHNLAGAWATASADQHRWRGLAVLGVDGTSLRVPDSTENQRYFGRPGVSRGEANAAYPQVRVLALMVLRSHLLLDLAFGPYHSSELQLAEPLLAKLPQRSLLLMDRGFANYQLFHTLADPAQQRHWLTRAKQGSTAPRLHHLKALGDGDELVQLRPSHEIRRTHPDLPEALTVRAIHYQRPGFTAQTLLTSLLDPLAFPAQEIIALYHERWELELAFDEVKNHTLERQEAALRCKTPARITQELWGLAIGYNLVRKTMADVAYRAGVLPTRISYRSSLLLLRSFWASAWITSAPSKLPQRLHELLYTQMPLLILPARRERAYPRQVKIKMSSYARNRPPASGNETDDGEA